MITSGLVLTLNADAALAEKAVASLRTRPEFTPGERNGRWLPLALEVADDAASRAAHDWLNSLPGVEFVDVVYVNLEGEENETPPDFGLRRQSGSGDGAFGRARTDQAGETHRSFESGVALRFPTQSKTPDVAAGIPACRRAGASLPGGENAAAKQDLERPVSRNDGKARSGRLEARPLPQAKMPATTQPRGDL